MQAHSTIFTPDQEETFLGELQPCVERIATKFFLSVRDRYSVDLADLLQEGMLAGWRAFQLVLKDASFTHRSAWSFCLKYAKGAILQSVLRKDRLHPMSLDDLLTCPDGSQLDLPELPATREYDGEKRAIVLNLLDCLTSKERLVIMAEFGIDDEESGCAPDRDYRALNLSLHAWHHAKYRGLSRLRREVATHLL